MGWDPGADDTSAAVASAGYAARDATRRLDDLHTCPECGATMASRFWSTHLDWHRRLLTDRVFYCVCPCGWRTGEYRLQYDAWDEVSNTHSAHDGVTLRERSAGPSPT